MLKTVCITHKEDADGLICAAYLKKIKNATPKLENYDSLKHALQKIDSSVTELFICDLGINRELIEKIVDINNSVKVTIVDHHPTSRECLNTLKESGVTVIYSEKDCASILVYNHFRNQLPKSAGRLAAYAAISDYFDGGPIASKLISSFDKLFTQHEALILTHALDQENSDEEKLAIVEELSKEVFPHKIDGVIEKAINNLEATTKLLKDLPLKAKKLNRVAYIQSFKEVSKGSLATLLLDSLDSDIGACYKKRPDGTVNISLRGKNRLTLDLGQITQKIAKKYGGFGGGHAKASGAKIPLKNLLSFLTELDKS